MRGQWSNNQGNQQKRTPPAPVDTHDRTNDGTTSIVTILSTATYKTVVLLCRQQFCDDPPSSPRTDKDNHSNGTSGRAIRYGRQ